MAETHRVSVPTLMTVLMYVIKTYLSRSIDSKTASATLSRYSEIAARDVQVEDLNMGFGYHPDHLAQGLASRSTDGIPSVEQICEQNDEGLKAFIEGIEDAVKVTLLIGGAQVDAAFTSGPQSVDRFAEVSVTNDLGELDAQDRILKEYIQIKPATLCRGNQLRLVAHDVLKPEPGLRVMIKDDYRRPIWAYDRTGDGEAILCRHYPTAQAEAIKEHFPHFKQKEKGSRKEDLWKGKSRYAAWAGVDPREMSNKELAAWAEANSL